MAFTQADLDAIDTALITAATEGIASVTINGQTVTNRSLDELRKLRDMVSDTLDEGDDRPGFGLRFQKIKPYYE